MQRTLDSLWKRAPVPAMPPAPKPKAAVASSPGASSQYFSPTKATKPSQTAARSAAASDPMVITAEDELDKVLMDVDLDAMEQSIALPAPAVPLKPAAASPVGRKRYIAEEKEEKVPIQNGQHSSDDDDEDSEVAEVPAPRSKATLLTSSTLAPAAEPSSILSKEEKRQAKLRKFIKENVKRYGWLEAPHDSQNRPPNHPDYDPSTLYIPANAQRAFTPFEQQYWDIKKKYFDTVVFFRKGKFYELFELDADIGHDVLGLRLSERHHMKMVGLPASAFDTWAGKLITQGYKITKVEQVEDHAAAEKRKNKVGIRAKGEEVIQRKVTQVITCGTVADEMLLTDYRTSYLLCLGYIEGGDIGVCLLDSAMRSFQFGSIPTEGECTALKALLLKFSPREILYERGRMPQLAVALLRNHDAPITVLPSFPTPAVTMQTFAQLNIPAPAILQNAAPQEICAFGGVVAYLERLLVLQETVQGATFTDMLELNQSALYIDGVSFEHLEVFETQQDRRSEGTLFSILDRCATPFGRRLLRTWLQHPLHSVEQINDRLNAIEYFQANPDFSRQIGEVFQRLPDLPRLTSRATSSRIILPSFLRLLEGFSALAELYANLFENIEPPTAACLNRVTVIGKHLPDLRILLAKFQFDRDKAREDAGITPIKGEVPEFDAAEQKARSYHAVDEARAKIDAFVARQRKELKSTAISLIEVRTKQRYALEAPAELGVPHTWEIASAGSAGRMKRYDVSELTPLVVALTNAEDEVVGTYLTQRQLVLTRYLARFAIDSGQWHAAASAAAELDALRSLALFSFESAGTFCRPEVVESEAPFLEIKKIHHPCLANRVNSFIPNDLSMGTQANPPALMLLTGPNMGGKSTLLRQTCLLVLLAHLGCYVPAENARLSLTDRIYTRIGAYDRLLQGQSTFMVELSETGGIMRGATRNSFVVLDELGRGTSTFDGYITQALSDIDRLRSYAVAYAVVNRLAYTTRCLCLFSTHYHLLTAEFAADPHICLYYMACHMAGSEVVFLYQLKKGACPKSYGLNVAQMAGLPAEVVAKADEKAKKFEEDTPLLSGNYLLASSDRLVTQVLSANSLSRLQHMQEIVKKRLQLQHGDPQ